MIEFTERFPYHLKQFHDDVMRPSVHATDGAIASVSNAEHTAYMRNQRNKATTRMESLDSVYETKKVKFYRECELVTIARVSQALPAHMNMTHEGDLITLPKSATTINAYKRAPITLTLKT